MSLRFDIRVHLKAKFVTGPSKGTTVEMSFPFMTEGSAKKYIKETMKNAQRGKLDYAPSDFKIILTVK